MNADGISAQSAGWEIIYAKYYVTKLSQFTACYDQLVYPFIFWNGKGGYGIIGAEILKKWTTCIRKVLICLVLQPRDHFIYAMEMLREYFICTASGCSVNIAVIWLLATQRNYLAREDEIRVMDDNDNPEKEFGL
jgi:hypothetical protein